MHRRAYLSAASVLLLGGCVGDPSPAGSGGGGEGEFDLEQSPSSGQIDRTETPRDLPDPVRDDRLRPGEGPNHDAEAIEISVHEYVNGVRREYDVPRFPWNEDMNESPRAHSRDMAHKGYFAKTAPNGQTFRPTGCNDWIEMLFRMHGPDATPDAVAVAALGAWMGSEDHKRNLVDANFLGHGIGAAVSSDGWIYLSHSLCG